MIIQDEATWDNTKSMEKEGTPIQKATVVGDTVGDPIKDAVGPH